MKRITKKDFKTLTISKGNETQVIRQRDILYCEVIDHKVYIHLSNISYDYFGTLENLQKQLDSRQGDTVTVSGGGHVFVSRRKQQEFAHELLRFVRKVVL